MHIAICDDERKERLYLQSLISRFDSSIKTSLYESAEEMFDGLQTQKCDIILLDIEMNGMNGFDAAKELASTENPPLIIFITNSDEYTHRGYEVAFRYLPKPVEYEELSKYIAAAAAKIAPQKITVLADGRTHVLAINDIMYFETFGHNLAVHTKKEKIETRMKLSDAEAMLPNHFFAAPHKGYLVNLEFVDKSEAKELVLTNKIRIPLSRRRKRDFEQSLYKYVREFR